MLKPSLRRAVVAAGAVPVVALAMSSPSHSTPTQWAQPDAAHRNFTATPLTPSSVVTADKAPSSRLARTPAALLKRTDSALINVMIKLRLRRQSPATRAASARLAATSPCSDRQEADRQRRRPSAPTARYLEASRERSINAAVRAAAPSARDRQSVRIVYGGVQAIVPANSVKRDPQDGRRRRRPARRARASRSPTRAPPSSTHRRHYTARRRTAERRPGPHLRQPRHRDLAGASIVRRPGQPAAPPGTARGVQLRGQPADARGRPVRLQQQAHRRPPFLATYLSNPARAAAEPFHTARDSNGHGTHTSSTSAGNVVLGAPIFGVERGPIHGLAPGAWVIGVQGLRHPGLLRLRLRRGRRSRRSSTASTSSTSRSPAAPTRSPIPSSWPSSMPTPQASSSPPRPATTGPGAGTVTTYRRGSTTVGGVDPDARVRDDAEPHRRWRRRRSTVDGASITAGRRPAPVVLSVGAAYSNALCTAPAPAGHVHRQDRRLRARRRTPGSRRASTSSGRRRGDDPLQPDPGGRRDRQPLAARRSTLPTGPLRGLHGRQHRRRPASFAAGRSATARAMSWRPSRRGGPGGLVHQARRHRAGRADPGRATRRSPEDVRRWPARRVLPGHRGDVDVVAARGRRGRPACGPRIPTWTPGQVKSALMTTSSTDVVKEDLATPADPFDFGAGRIDHRRGRARPLTLRRDRRPTSSRWANDPTHARPPQHPVDQRADHCRAG